MIAKITRSRTAIAKHVQHSVWNISSLTSDTDAPASSSISSYRNGILFFKLALGGLMLSSTSITFAVSWWFYFACLRVLLICPHGELQASHPPLMEVFLQSGPVAAASSLLLLSLQLRPCLVPCHTKVCFLAEIVVEHAYRRCRKLGNLAACHLESILSTHSTPLSSSVYSATVSPSFCFLVLIRITWLLGRISD